MTGQGRPSLSVLHFADAHIDIANYGRHDPETALPVRVGDFLGALDQIVDAAVERRVDLVIFAGDAYKDRNPQPTFQRAWGERMMRLSEAGIQTVLLVGNHDIGPAAGRAHTLQEFVTFGVKNIHVADRIALLGPDELALPVQVITVPWLSRSALLSRSETSGKSLGEIMAIIEDRLAQTISRLLDKADAGLPLILTAHASVQGARYGSERAVMLGQELVLSGKVVSDSRLDYVALGHIHRHQALSNGRHPPIVYPGSIERIDFGEAKEQKGYVVATISRGRADWQFMPLKTRPFVDLHLEIESADGFMEEVMNKLPEPAEVADAICRVSLTYPREWEPLVDESVITDRFKLALSLQIQKRRHVDRRARLGDTVSVESLGPEELLAQYWQTIGLEAEEASAMQSLAKEVLAADGEGL